jgi:hypothetical protein
VRRWSETRCAASSMANIPAGCEALLVCIVPVQLGDTALLLACENGRLDVAKWLVAEAGSNPSTERNNVSAHISTSLVTLHTTHPPTRHPPTHTPATQPLVALPWVLFSSARLLSSWLAMSATWRLHCGSWTWLTSTPLPT